MEDNRGSYEASMHGSTLTYIEYFVDINMCE